MLCLEDIRREYRRLDALLGIDTSGISLAFSARMVRRYGVCRFEKGRPVEIRLAAFLQQDEAQLMQTARHEYAHAAAMLLTGKPHGHDAVWKQLCLRVGCEPARLAQPCQAAEERAQEYAAAHADRTYYLVRCEGCGAVSRYQRRGKIVTMLLQNPKTTGCVCRRCGGHAFTLQTEKGEQNHDNA